MKALGTLVTILWATAAIGGCGEGDKESGAWTPGKGDGNFDIVEVGPAPTGATSIVLDHRVPAYRIESFGDTKVSINLKGKDGADPYVVVEGPLAGMGDQVAPGGGVVAADDDDSGYSVNAKLDLTLTAPGVYRVLVGTYESMALAEAPEGTVELTVACAANCTRPAIDQKTFVHTLQAAGGPQLTQLAQAKLGEMLNGSPLADQLGAQLATILADPNLTGIERFPTIPLAAVAAIRPALGAIDAEEPKPDEVVTGELFAVLGSCEPTRALPSPINPMLPGVGYGHFPNVKLSPCQAAHAGKLAKLLTSLAADNGSQVTYKGQTIRTPRELFAALLASGHTIETRNERTYANFLSLTLGDRDVIWPVWLDTGIQLSSGQSLVIPVGHSGHAWRISGPQLDTRVMFYLGTSGAGFFGQTSIRPAWTGEVVGTTETVGPDGGDADYMLRTVDVAASYLRRNRTERETVAMGLPADGYGYVGVCNDSNAVVEYLSKGTISTFPLLRAAELDAAPDLGDGLDAAVRALPKDGDGLDDVQDALRRAVAMQPDTAASWDPVLAAQLETAASDVR